MKRYQTIEREISFGKHAHATITLDAEGLIRATFYRYEGGQCFRQAETFDMGNVWAELMDFYKRSEYLMNGMIRRLSVAWAEMKEEQTKQMDYLHQQANEENAFFDIENKKEEKGMKLAKSIVSDVQNNYSKRIFGSEAELKALMKDLQQFKNDVNFGLIESHLGTYLDVVSARDYEHEATLYAEKYGIIEGSVKGNIFKYTDTYTGYKWEKNLYTGENVLVSSMKGGNR